MLELGKFISKSFSYISKKLSGKAGIAVAIIIVAWMAFPFLPKGSVNLPNIKVNSVPPVSASAEISGIPAQSQLALITEPDDGIASITQTVNKSAISLDLVMYEFDDQNMEQALVDAEKRGVAVRVLMQNLNIFGKNPNQAAFDFLKAGNVAVKWAPDYFPLTHQKTLVMDGGLAFIMTFNFTPRYYSSGRDFAAVDADPKDVSAIESAFDSDWNGSQETAGVGDDLVWSPGSANTLLALINNAKSSLDIYNEEMADTRIISALETAAGRGVTVRVDMTYSTNWKDAFNELASHGVTVRTYASTAKKYIHAKVIIADDKTAFLGSENFSFQSLDGNRELGILIANPEMVSSLEATFTADWVIARPFAGSALEK